MSPHLDRAIHMMFRDLWQPPALVAGLCTSAGFVWRRCLGTRMIGPGMPVDEMTTFALASATKTMAVAAIARLCEQDRLTWDTRVVDVDSTFDAGDARVTNTLTLRDLACHRTGWTSSEGRHRAAASSRADLVRRLRYHGFRHAFREHFAYCTDAFSVLGHVVDVVTRASWEEFAHAQLLKPLDMRRTFFSVDTARASGNFASPHLLLQDAYVPIPWQYEDGIATPAGGANSCLADVAAWLGAWLASGSEPKPWSAAQRRLMLEPQIANAGPYADAEFSCAIPITDCELTDKGYALGWYCHRYRGERIYHHTGSIRGFRSIVALLPERQLGFAALVNANAAFLPRALFQAVVDDLQGSDPTTWTDKFFELELQQRRSDATVYRQPVAAHGNAGVLADLPGAYRDDGRFGTVLIAAEPGGFRFEAGKLRYRLLPLDATTLECHDPCGPLSIAQGLIRVRRGSDACIAALEFKDAEFRRC